MTELHEISALTYKTCNSGDSYRVARYDWGRSYMVSARKRKNGIVYYYATQRQNGKIYLCYIGVCGSITPGAVRRAIDALRQKVLLAVVNLDADYL